MSQDDLLFSYIWIIYRTIHLSIKSSLVFIRSIWCLLGSVLQFLSLFDFFFFCKNLTIAKWRKLARVSLLEDELSYATEMHNTWNTHLYTQLYTKCCITMKRKVKMCFPIKYSRIIDESFSHFSNKIDRDSFAKHSPSKEQNVQQVIFIITSDGSKSNTPPRRKTSRVNYGYKALGLSSLYFMQIHLKMGLFSTFKNV